MASTILNTTARFGMVEFPVALRKATEKKDVKFDRAVKTMDGSYEKIARHEVGAVSGEKVDPDNIERGLWEGDEFHPIPQDEIQKIVEAGALDNIEIEEFVPIKDFTWDRIQGGYYLVPQKGQIGAKPLRILRDAMKAERAVGIARLCLKPAAGLPRLAALYESKGRVMVALLAYADEARVADESRELLDQVQVPPGHLKVARELISSMKGAKLLDEATDTVAAMRAELLEDARNSRPVRVATKPKDDAKTPDDLLDALAASVEAAKEKVPA